MSASAASVEDLLDSLPQKDRIRIAERVFADAGFGSALPSVQPVEPTLPAPEAMALAAVGLRVSPQTHGRAEAARGRYVTTFLDLFNQADTPTELARKLNLDPSRIRQRIRERTLLAIDFNGEKRVPRFQFEKGNVEVPGLAKVLTLVDDKMSPLAFAMWFLTPTTDLPLGEDEGSTSPRDWLLQTGDVNAVLALVENL